jgi:dihydroneopterin aldolase
MYLIRIKDLQAQTTLGVYDWEKQARRLVILNIELKAEESGAAASDALCDAVDYAQLETRVLAYLENHSFQLLERLVAEVAALLLSVDRRIAWVRVEADKPGALRLARSVSVSAERVREA